MTDKVLSCPQCRHAAIYRHSKRLTTTAGAIGVWQLWQCETCLQAFAVQDGPATDGANIAMTEKVVLE